MNKTEVIAEVSQKTGLSAEVCAAAMNALEEVSGSVLLGRIKGVRLDESAAVGEISQKAGISEGECRAILSAFEETFGESLSSKFRFFSR